MPKVWSGVNGTDLDKISWLKYCLKINKNNVLYVHMGIEDGEGCELTAEQRLNTIISDFSEDLGQRQAYLDASHVVNRAIPDVLNLMDGHPKFGEVVSRLQAISNELLSRVMNPPKSEK